MGEGVHSSSLWLQLQLPVQPCEFPQLTHTHVGGNKTCSILQCTATGQM
jgi:hypothetical protein